MSLGGSRATHGSVAAFERALYERLHGRTAVRAVVRPSVRIHVHPRHVAVEVDADDDVRPRDHIKRRIREIIATLRELERPA